MSEFWKKILKFSALSLLAIFPLFIILGVYIYFDPFRIIRPTEPYFIESNPMYVGWNKSFVSTEAFKNNHDKYKYDSYIFGASLSIGYRAHIWQKYLPGEPSIFHFDASSETLDGVLMKMKFVVKNNERIKNALFILDPMLFKRHNPKNIHLYLQHPDLTEAHDNLYFHWRFFYVFLHSEFVSAYIDLQLNGFKPYMTKKSIFTREFPDYDAKTNEEHYPFYDNVLAVDPESFYKERLAQFKKVYSDTTVTFEPFFDDNIIGKLKEMENILKAEKTSYKIIFPPLYSLQTLSDRDKNIMYEIFGRENICDCSGLNELSVDYHSFYDYISHPRPSTCDKVLSKAYGD